MKGIHCFNLPKLRHKKGLDSMGITKLAEGMGVCTDFCNGIKDECIDVLHADKKTDSAFHKEENID